MHLFKKLTIIFLLVVIANSCGLIIPHVIPFNNLPIPTGLYNVGTQNYEWEDKSRKEWFTEDEQDFRKLVIQVWYPTSETSENYSNYLDFPEKRIDPLSKRIDLPKVLIKHITEVKTNSIKNAEIVFNDRLYPLIIFSHGLGGMRMQNTVQMEELASRGYFVLSLDHPYDAYITIYSDETTADYRSGINNDLSEEEFWKLRRPQINTRASDLIFIIDKVYMLSNDINSIWRCIDKDNIGVFGHSFGGATCILASFNDRRIDACLNLDGWIVPIESKIIQNGINVPFLYIGQEKWEKSQINNLKIDSLIISSNGTKKILPNTKHFDYSDTPQFSPISSKLGISGEMAMDSLRIKINLEVLSFFDLHLKGIQR